MFLNKLYVCSLFGFTLLVSCLSQPISDREAVNSTSNEATSTNAPVSVDKQTAPQETQTPSIQQLSVNVSDTVYTTKEPPSNEIENDKSSEEVNGIAVIKPTNVTDDDNYIEDDDDNDDKPIDCDYWANFKKKYPKLTKLLKKIRSNAPSFITVFFNILGFPF